MSFHVFTHLWLVSMLYTAHKLIFIILNYYITTCMCMMLCTHVTLYTSNLQGPCVWEASWSPEVLVSVYICLRWRILWKNTDLHKHGFQNSTPQVVTTSTHLQCSSQRRGLTLYNLQYKPSYCHVIYCTACTDEFRKTLRSPSISDCPCHQAQYM